MIHQVKLADDDQERLAQIIEFQLCLLYLAADNKMLDPGIIESGLNNPRVNDPKLATSWVTRKTKSLLDPLNEFAEHSNQREKEQFVDGIAADINLLFAPVSAKRLNTQITKTSPKWQQSAGKFLGHFYELFSQGFPAELFHDSQYTTGYTRYDFVDSFKIANPSLFLCSMCDTTAYRSKMAGKTHTSIEHFFPKSIYPHLAIHPFNLIPICTHCNSGAAGSKDPVTYVNTGIVDILLPYRHDEGLSEQAFVEVTEIFSPRGAPPLQLTIKEAKGKTSARFIEIFDAIYEIQDRWNNDLDEIGEHVFRRITQLLSIDVQNGIDLSDGGFLVQRLKMLMAMTSKESLGQDPYSFVTIWMIKYYIDCIEKMAGSPVKADIHSEICNWADNQKTRWREFELHADDLMSRVP